MFLCLVVSNGSYVLEIVSNSHGYLLTNVEFKPSGSTYQYQLYVSVLYFSTVFSLVCVFLVFTYRIKIMDFMFLIIGQLQQLLMFLLLRIWWSLVSLLEELVIRGLELKKENYKIINYLYIIVKYVIVKYISYSKRFYLKYY